MMNRRSPARDLPGNRKGFAIRKRSSSLLARNGLAEFLVFGRHQCQAV